MNFQQVQQANGQNVIIFGTIVEFKGQGVNPKSNKPYMKVSVLDDTGVKKNVTLRGALPTMNMINQRVQFNLRSYQGTYQGQPYTGYSGFWYNRATVNQGQPQMPPQAAQAAPQQPTYTPVPQTTPQSTYTPPKKRDYDKENRGKCRFGFYQAMLSSGVKPADIISNLMTLSAVEKLVRFSMEGIDKDKPMPEPSPQPTADTIPGEPVNEPVNDDDIPF